MQTSDVNVLSWAFLITYHEKGLRQCHGLNVKCKIVLYLQAPTKETTLTERVLEVQATTKLSVNHPRQ